MLGSLLLVTLSEIGSMEFNQRISDMGMTKKAKVMKLGDDMILDQAE